MRLSTKVAHNTIIQAMGKVISTILGLLAVAVMARYLGAEGFGQYTTIITFLSFFAVLADLGLTLVTVQMISDPLAEENIILSNIFGLRLVTAAIFLALAPLTAIFLTYPPVIKFGIAITAASFFFAALNQVLVGLFQKHLKMQIVSLAEICGRAALLIGILLSAYYRLNLTGILIATIISSLVSFLIHYLFAGKLAKIKLQFNVKIWSLIIKKSWPLAITIIFNLVYLRADILILSLVKSQAEVGIYGAAYKVIDVLTTLPFMIAGLVLPVMSAAWAEENRERFKHILQKSFDVMAILAIPLSVGAQLTAGPIMVLVAGAGFSAAAGVLRILILAASLIFLGCMFAHAVIAADKQKSIIGAYIFTAISSVIGYLIFIPRFSYYGAAWVTVYSELVIAFASYYIIRKYSAFRFKTDIIVKSLAASLIMALLIYVCLDKINLLFVLPLAALTYFTALYLLKGISKQEVADLLNK